MKLSNFPDKVTDHYGLKDKVEKNGFVSVKCVCGMYGLPHAGIIYFRNCLRNAWRNMGTIKAR